MHRLARTAIRTADDRAWLADRASAWRRRTLAVERRARWPSHTPHQLPALIQTDAFERHDCVTRCVAQVRSCRRSVDAALPASPCASSRRASEAVAAASASGRPDPGGACRRCGLTAKGVSALERGERQRPYAHTVRALAEALALADRERAVLLSAIPRRSRPLEATGYPARLVGVPPVVRTVVGRDQEMSALIEILALGHVRLLTLTGAGGVSKNRLAIAIAAKVAPQYADGVLQVGLASVSHPTLAAAIARAVGISERFPSPRVTHWRLSCRRAICCFAGQLRAGTARRASRRRAGRCLSIPDRPRHDPSPIAASIRTEVSSRAASCGPVAAEREFGSGTGVTGSATLRPTRSRSETRR